MDSLPPKRLDNLSIRRKVMGETLAPLTIFLLGLFTFTTAQILIASDMGWHMNAALNMFNGRGYVNMDWSPLFKKGPIWPFMISLTYHLFGVSPWSGFWAVRIFAVLNPVLIYYFGKKLYDNKIGLAASLLTLSSYSVNYWSYRHLDAVWPFFTILSILYLYLAIEKNNYIYFVISGILLALAYLVKHVPILLIPLPFILIFFIKDYRSKKNIKGASLWLFLFFFITLPWIYYVYSHTYNISLSLLGPGGEGAAHGSLSGDSFQLLKKYFIGLWAFYGGAENSIANNFTLAPLFICAWIHTIYLSLRGEKESLLIVLVLLLLSPVMAHVGNSNLRVGQLILLVIFSYLVTARFCLSLARNGLALIKRVHQFDLGMERYVYWAVVAGLFTIQTLVSHNNDLGNREFLTRSSLHHWVSQGTNSKRVLGTFGQVSRKCGKWIQNNLPLGSRLMVSNEDEGKAIFFYTGGDYPVFHVPIINSKVLGYENMHKEGWNPIFISSWARGLDPRNKIFAMRQSDLYQAIAEKKINYLILGKRRNFLTLYFESDPNFKFVKGFGNGAVRIFEVLSAQEKLAAKDFNILVSYRLVEYLDGLRVAKDDRLDWYRTAYFKNHLKLDDAFVDLLSDKQRVKMSDRIRMVEVGRVYEIRKQQ